MSKELFKDVLHKSARGNMVFTNAETSIIGLHNIISYEEKEFRISDGSVLRLRDHLTFGRPINPSFQRKEKGRVKNIKSTRKLLPRIPDDIDVSLNECNLFWGDTPYETNIYGELLTISKNVLEDQCTDMIDVVESFYIERSLFTENYNSLNGDGVNYGLINAPSVNKQIYDPSNMKLTKFIGEYLKAEYEVNAGMYVNTDGLQVLENIKGTPLEKDKDGDLYIGKYKVFVLGKDELINPDGMNTYIVVGDLKRSGVIVSSNLKIESTITFFNESTCFRAKFATVTKISNTEAYLVMQVAK